MQETNHESRLIAEDNIGPIIQSLRCFSLALGQQHGKIHTQE